MIIIRQTFSSNKTGYVPFLSSCNDLFKNFVYFIASIYEKQKALK